MLGELEVAKGYSLWERGQSLITLDLKQLQSPESWAFLSSHVRETLTYVRKVVLLDFLFHNSYDVI